ncbi:MAG: HD domain-containing phosphohydrolase, partial [Chloroflexota bacterium]
YPVRIFPKELQLDQRLPLADHPLCQRVFDGTKPLLLQSDNPEAGEFELFLHNFAQNLCIVPLQFNGQPFGILLLGEARETAREPFTTEKLRLAESIADQAVNALHRALLSEQASHRLKHIACLREIDSAIASSFDLHLSLEVILKHVIEQLEVDAVAVLVVNSSLQRLEYRGGRGFRSQAIDHMDQHLDEGQAGLSIRERRMIHIPDVAASVGSFTQSEIMKAEQFSVYIAIPLIVKGKAKGVLEIYHRSPLDPDQEWFEFLNSLAGQAALAIDNDQLYYGLQRSNIELDLAYDATIEGWSQALDLRDQETEGHSQRVTEMAVKMAQSFGIYADELRQVRWGALLHDIGKMGVPDSILLKPGPLTDEEWVVMKKHPRLAYEMLASIQYLQKALDIPYCHHEKWDGTGYPRGLTGEQIPLVARIFAVVDVWDALISDRPYREAWSEEKALKHIQEQSGIHFDPKVVKAFLLDYG